MVSWEGYLIYCRERVTRCFYSLPGNMIKTREDYQSYLSTQNTKRVEKHHILPVSAYWPDVTENLATILQGDHLSLHRAMDVPPRLFNDAIRQQRKQMNWHIVLTEKDILGIASIQENYLWWLTNLPDRAIDMHDIKLWELATLEAGKLSEMVWATFQLDLWDALYNHQQYVEAQILQSRHILSLLQNK